MRVLFDNGVPRGVATGLTEHEIEEARNHGWDRNLRHQQNFTGRTIAVVILGKASWPLIRNHLAAIADAVAVAAPGSVTDVEIPSA